MKTLRQDQLRAQSRQIEAALEAAVSGAALSAPPRLGAALRDAVFPGGARVRARLCLAVAAACGDDCPRASTAAAVAIELLHCGSLVHDDLPCFDNAALRRGKPTVHVAHGEPLAVLAGDALIVLAMETLVRGTAQVPHRLPSVLATICAATGMPHGIIAGQAWESEKLVALSEYHRAKTAALFVAATVAGALTAGASATRWGGLGERLGEAYQVADDLRDVAQDASAMGKPAGQDAALGRPSAAAEMGPRRALAHFESLVQAATDAIPDCNGAEHLRLLIRMEALRLVPPEMARELSRRAA
ncbi:MAG: polyprenyl synthetase family protein [Burkholderiales bacterium]|nr:polyprenyl synthetase family protein [Burkholderiales bacterium]